MITDRVAKAIVLLRSGFSFSRLEKIAFPMGMILIPAAFFALNFRWVLQSGQGYFYGNLRPGFLSWTQEIALRAMGQGTPELSLQTDYYFRGVLFIKLTVFLVKHLGNSFLVYSSVPNFFYILFMAGVGVLGRMSGNGWTGLTALLLAALSPTVFLHSRIFYMDLAMAALVMWALAAWLTADRNGKVHWYIISGILFAMAMSARSIAGLYLLPPMLASILVALPQDAAAPRTRRQRAFALAAVVGGGLALSIPPYISEFSSILHQAKFMLFDPSTPTLVELNGMSSPIFFIRNIGPALFAAAILAAPRLLLRPPRFLAPHAVLFLLPTAALFVKPTGMERFILPALGSLAVMVSVALTAPGPRLRESSNRKQIKTREWPAFLLVIFAIVGSAWWLKNLETPPRWAISLNLGPTFSEARIQRPEWIRKRLTEIFSPIKKPNILYISSNPRNFLHAEYWTFLIRLLRPDAQVYALDNSEPLWPNLPELMLRHIPDADFFLYHAPAGAGAWPNKNAIASYSNNSWFRNNFLLQEDRWLGKFLQGMDEVKNRFQLSAEISIHTSRYDDGVIYIYQRVRANAPLTDTE